MDRRKLLALCLSLVAAGAAAQSATNPDAGVTGAPAGVSPGGAASFELAAACPTFSWTAVAGARGYEIVVYEAAGDAAAPALEARLPAGASTWTPAADRCLVSGQRYGWSVRAVTETAQARGQWSEALLFEVAATPADLAAALEVLRNHLGSDAFAAALEAAGAAGSDAASSAETREGLPATQKDSAGIQQGLGGPIIAVRGEVPDAAGETYGVRGVSNSATGAGVRADNNNASGADLMLGGSPVASLTETGLSRNSGGNLTFNFTNPGAGTMTVQADGSNLMTAAAGSAIWVDQAGDTMAGTLSMGGNPLTSVGPVGLNTGSEVTKGGFRFLFDDGIGNFSAGLSALANTTGGNNTAVGQAALTFNTTGTYNTALGRSAMFNNTTGFYNVALGSAALAANTTGYRNVAIGDYAMRNSTSGTQNVAVGQYALRSNISAGNNVAIGNNALFANTYGGPNVAIGVSTLSSNLTGGQNVAVGFQALQYNTTASYNNALGHQALASTTAPFNVGMGGRALFANTTGFSNIAIGDYAMRNNTTGSSNIAVGGYGGFNLTTGSYNIMIGNQGVAGESGAIRIGGGLQTATFIDGIHGATSAGGIGVFVNASGQLGTATSSRRFKEDVADIGEASDALLELRPVSFHYTEETVGLGERPLEYGLIAEEVAEVFPELVAYGEDGEPYTVRYHLLVPLLLNEVQREREKTEALLARVKALERGRARDGT